MVALPYDRKSSLWLERAVAEADDSAPVPGQVGGMELTGHAAIGHVRLNELVQGHEIVLEGVESDEAPNLANAVERAVDATHQACAEGPPEPTR